MCTERVGLMEYRGSVLEDVFLNLMMLFELHVKEEKISHNWKKISNR